MNEVLDKYSDMQLVQRLDVVRDLARNKRVLHLGCTNAPYTKEAIEAGMLLHFELEKVAADTWGIDTDHSGIEVLRSMGSSNLVIGDLESINVDELPSDFDVIIAGEMIEHLNNPGQFLRAITPFMNDRTLLVITTINAYCALRFIWYGFRGDRGRNEMVHPDHVAYYSYSTLRLLVERHDMQVDRFLFYDIGKEHRPFNSRAINMINDVAVRIAPQWADGIIAVCRRK